MEQQSSGAGLRRTLWAAALLLTAITANAQIKPAPKFSGAQLQALPTDSWITNGGNLYNQRYSPLDQINRGNVAKLKGKWRIHLNSGLGANHSGQGQPIVHDGVIYITTGESDVFAVSVETGAILWSYKANIPPASVRPCCNWINRGVAINDGKVFVGRLDSEIVALDQRNGKVLWSNKAADPGKGYTITSAPVYYDGLVIVGYAGGERAIRGKIEAFSADTGKLVWTFNTIPGPGEFGHDTWPADNDAWKFGGAPIWQTPAIDPELGLLYLTTGNAAPDYNGSGRAGDNLFTVSFLALEVKTGKYRWHFQQVRHDLWDYDSPNPVILFDAPYAGVMRKGIAEVSKTGWVYILDRVTGKPLTPIEDRPVPQDARNKTAATQPFVIGDSVVPQQIDVAPEGFDLVNQGRIFTPFWDKQVIYKPQMAVNWPPSSYDPKTHRMFICGNDNIGASTGDGRDGFTAPPAEHTSWLRGTGAVNSGMPRMGTYTAMDLKTNRIAWQWAWPSGCSSGSLATAGGLIFIGRGDRYTALDMDNGKQVWSFQTDAGVAASGSTFLHKGRQHVVVLSAGSLGGGKGDSLWLFSLDGSIDSLPARGGAGRGAGPLTALPLPTADMPAGAPNLVQGKALYRQYCSGCHGENGLGGTGNGASLATIGSSAQQMANVAWAGRTNGTSAMPSFRGTITLEQLRDVVNYVSIELFPAHAQ
jgi:quinohemoprotein ethanol dehydrogenase